MNPSAPPNPRHNGADTFTVAKGEKWYLVFFCAVAHLHTAAMARDYEMPVNGIEFLELERNSFGLIRLPEVALCSFLPPSRVQTFAGRPAGPHPGAAPDPPQAIFNETMHESMQRQRSDEPLGWEGTNVTYINLRQASEQCNGSKEIYVLGELTAELIAKCQSESFKPIHVFSEEDMARILACGSC